MAYWLSSILSEQYIFTLSCNLTHEAVLSLFMQLLPDEYLPKRLEKEAEEVDFIIVGAGSAGCVLANRLSENESWSVLLLEEGREEPLLASIPAYFASLLTTEISRKYPTVADENSCLANNGCVWFSGKVMGGSSTVNGLLYIRGNKNDFNTWAKMGNPGWSYEEVLPLFIKSENNRDKDILRLNPGYHGTGGYQSVQRLPYIDPNSRVILQALEELGLNDTDVNGQNQIGSMRVQATSEHGSRASANVAFLRPIRKYRRNLHIKTNSRAMKILIDSETKRAIGVEYISTITGETRVVMARKEVIVSAGTVESSKLLMLSGIGPSDELEKYGINVMQNLSVGQNLHDHISFLGIHSQLGEPFSYNPDCKTREIHLKEYLKHKKGPVSSIGFGHACAFVQSRHEQNSTSPDIMLMFTPNFTAFDSTIYYNNFLLGPVLLAPKSRGYVKLNETDPVWGNPIIAPRYLSDHSDLERLIDGTRLALKLFNTTAFRKNNFKMDKTPLPGCEEFQFNTDQYWRCLIRQNTISIFHPAGTCKMGPKEDTEAVVDARLRVYGIKGLRVADASVMPVVTRGNTNAPTIMIGEKASQMIKEDWA